MVNPESSAFCRVEARPAIVSEKKIPIDRKVVATSITPPIANARALNRSASQPETGPAMQNPMGSQPPPRHCFFAALPSPQGF